MRPLHRPRRLRQHPNFRRMVREHHIFVDDLIYPLFIKAGQNLKEPIASMPGQFQFSVDQLSAEIEEIIALDIPAVLLFGIPAEKDLLASDSYADDGIVQQAIAAIKKQAPNLMVITDICCCEFMSHGHCGVVDESCCYGPDVDNDKTLPLLAKQAVSHATAGADMVAPSGMMDGAVEVMRHALDEAGFEKLPIMGYTVKYASSLYGPFRDAAEGAPSFGDRKTYQMDVCNANEALREAHLEVEEGADILMVKPGTLYLDIIRELKNEYPEFPLAVYHVSGEYAMLKAAAEKGWLDETNVMMETMVAFKRAGANMIITYYAKDVAKYLMSH